MWNRIRNIWRPENFHYAHKLARVAETMTSEIELRFLETMNGRDRVVYEGVGRHACLEAQGDLERVLDA